MALASASSACWNRSSSEFVELGVDDVADVVVVDNDEEEDEVMASHTLSGIGLTSRGGRWMFKSLRGFLVNFSNCMRMSSSVSKSIFLLRMYSVWTSDMFTRGFDIVFFSLKNFWLNLLL